jgi:hypothetical protein
MFWQTLLLPSSGWMLTGNFWRPYIQLAVGSEWNIADWLVEWESELLSNWQRAHGWGKWVVEALMAMGVGKKRWWNDPPSKWKMQCLLKCWIIFNTKHDSSSKAKLQSPKCYILLSRQWVMSKAKTYDNHAHMYRMASCLPLSTYFT